MIIPQAPANKCKVKSDVARPPAFTPRTVTDQMWIPQFTDLCSPQIRNLLASIYIIIYFNDSEYFYKISYTNLI